MPIPSNALRGTAVAPNTVSPGSSIPSTPEFRLFWHPDAYKVVSYKGQPMFVPELSQVRLIPGVDGYTQGDENVLLGNMRQRGFQLLDPIRSLPAELSPDGQPGYIRQYPAKGGGFAYHEVFSEIIPTLSGRVEIRALSEHRTKWLLWLQSQNVIPQPTDGWVEQYLAKQAENATIASAHVATEQTKAANAAAAHAKAAAALEAQRAHAERTAPQITWDDEVAANLKIEPVSREEAGLEAVAKSANAIAQKVRASRQPQGGVNG